VNATCKFTVHQLTCQREGILSYVQLLKFDIFLCLRVVTVVAYLTFVVIFALAVMWRHL